GTVDNNQTFTDLLLENNVSYQAMRYANPNLPTTRLAPGTRYCAPPAQSRALCENGYISYVMELGETLYALTRKLGVSPEMLLVANPTLAPSDFIPGRVICVP
ncbi:MAG: LysM domain-containing protein, partial [Clostridia bacterium]